MAVLIAYLLSQKAYRIQFEYVRLAKAGGAALLLYGIGSLIDGMTWPMLLARVALIGSYPILLYALGFFSKDEKVVIARVLRRSR